MYQTSSTYQMRLEEVASRGALAQAAHARKLLVQLADAGTNLPSSLVREIETLFDAYLNDPYLTRNDTTRGSQAP